MANLFPATFLSCDWGTTSFRLRIVSSPSGEVLREVRSSQGVKSIHSSLGAQPSAAAREDAFAAVLHSQISSVLAAHGYMSDPVPLLISGMASSTIGWRQVPYAPAPFALDGHDLRVERLNWNAPAQVSETWFVSGAATATDMMRGEETEIIGLMAHESMAPFRNCSTLLLSGTHSKLVTISDGTVADFRTFMTGELFDLLRGQSVLRASVTASRSEFAREMDGFVAGAAWQRGRCLSEALFRVRTRDVLDHEPPQANLAFLSGILIGAELTAAPRDSNRPLIIAANDAVAPLYRAAAETLDLPNVTTLSPERVDRASAMGHALLLTRLGGVA